MSAWSTVAISLGSAGIGATAALTGTALQLRHARADRERAEEAAWRNRAGTIIGPIQGVLADMDPRAIAESDGGRSNETLANIGRRWWRARDDLLVFAAASPLPQVAVAGQEAAAAVARSWTSVTSLNRALQAGGEREHGGGALLERACSDYDAAAASVDRLWRLASEATTRA